MTPVFAVLWYKDETTYARFRALCEDKEEFFDSYAEWLASAQKKFGQHQREGRAILKIEADPDEFALWCKATAKKPNGRARASYAGLQASKKDYSGN